MKLVFDKDEFKQICEANAGIFPDMITPEDVFSLNFSISDKALAEFALFGLMNDKLPEVSIRVDIKSIPIAPNCNHAEFMNKLREMRDIIDTIVPNHRGE